MRRLGIAALAVSALVMAGMLSPSAATWTDAETATGTFAAKTVPAPDIAGCSIGTLLGVINSATVDYRPPAGYAQSDVHFGVGTQPDDLEPASPARSQVNATTYRATFSKSLLEDLLGTLLSALFGSQFYIGSSTVDGTWQSETRLVRVNLGLLGLGSSCTVL